MRTKRTLTEEARRAQIVAAAIEVIADSGAQASFKVIADRAGLSSTGLISYHFANRQDLIEEVGRQILETFGAFVLERTDGVDAPAEVLHAFVAANIAFLRTHRAHAAALLRIKQDVASAALALSDQSQLADVLRRGQASGAFGEFDAHLVAVFVLSVRDGIIRQLELEPGLDLDAAAREFARLVDLTTSKG
ncbi:TetR family transcriptional regulator [Kribbella pittospori]|uniref:TetR family transcriptional regulator n=1 Tax=Kribbella pittospori TaxID=722689 RepID=A0A4R0KMK1_9ACTN|nr:TetR family transcriptional regulator [Kribbella pittospori]TCC60504.1 TetR family transcriptional regulator [Kribbella pittospori]